MSVIIQKKDDDEDIWCDIDSDEIIPDKEKLNVKFVSISEQPLEVRDENNSLNNIKVLYAEQIEILSETKCNNTDEPIQNRDVEFNENSFDDEKNNESKITSTVEIKKGPGSITYPTILPPLSFDLKNKLDTYGVLAIQAKLIYHWGLYLWQKTEGKPLKRDYHNLASSIVQAYPSLKGGQFENSIVRSQLSAWVRNHRMVLKKQQIREKIAPRTVQPINVELAPTETLESQKLNVSRAVLELEKLSDKDTPHVRKLLNITFEERQNFIKNEAKSIFDLVSKYPHLKNSELILHEFYQLKNISSDTLTNNTKLMFDKLKKMFEVSEENNYEGTILTKLMEILSKKIKKTTNFKPVFILQEVRSSTDSLIAEEGESPRAVIYMNSDEVQQAFIVADNNIKITVSNPTIPKVVDCLLAAYYVWDTVFPKPYINILQYIESELLGTPIMKNTVLFKFIRKRDETIIHLAEQQ